MTTPVIIDIIIAAALVTFTVFGARRGLFRSLAGLLAVVVALAGAGIIASALSGPVANVVTPLIAERIELQVEEALSVQTPGQMPEADLEAPAANDDGGDITITDLLALMGLDSDVRDSVAKQAEERVRDAGTSIAMAVVESLAQSIIYAALFILSFLGLSILLKLLIRAVDTLLQLPGLHLANRLGGGAIGLAEGALLLFLGIWVLRRFGVSFETDVVDATHILRFFTTNTPLSVLSFLQ